MWKFPHELIFSCSTVVVLGIKGVREHKLYFFIEIFRECSPSCCMDRAKTVRSKTANFPTSNHITWHWLTSRDVESHHATLNHITWHWITSRNIGSHHVTLDHITWHWITSRNIGSHHLTLDHITWHWITSRDIGSHHVTLDHITWHWITSRESINPSTTFRSCYVSENPSDFQRYTSNSLNVLPCTRGDVVTRYGKLVVDYNRCSYCSLQL
jgi:hypothetical protein